MIVCDKKLERVKRQSTLLKKKFCVAVCTEARQRLYRWVTFKLTFTHSANQGLIGAPVSSEGIPAIP